MFCEGLAACGRDERAKEETMIHCPKCGNGMEPGTVYSPRGYLFWTSGQEKLKNFQGPKDAVRLRPVGTHTGIRFFTKSPLRTSPVRRCGLPELRHCTFFL